MYSRRLRQRTDPTTSAPAFSAYSARWLPTNPVIPVIRTRMSAIVLQTSPDRPPAALPHLLKVGGGSGLGERRVHDGVVHLEAASQLEPAAAPPEGPAGLQLPAQAVPVGERTAPGGGEGGA